MTKWLRHASLWTWPRTSWVADTMLHSKLSLPWTLADCPWNMFVWLGLLFPQDEFISQEAPQTLMQKNLGRPTLGALQICPGPVWILAWRWPGFKPGLSYTNNDIWNVKGKDKNHEREEWLLLTGKVKEGLGRWSGWGPAADAGSQSAQEHSVLSESPLWRVILKEEEIMIV